MQNKKLENIEWKKDFYKNDVEALIIRFKRASFDSKQIDAIEIKALYNQANQIQSNQGLIPNYNYLTILSKIILEYLKKEDKNTHVFKQLFNELNEVVVYAESLELAEEPKPLFRKYLFESMIFINHQQKDIEKLKQYIGKYLENISEDSYIKSIIADMDAEEKRKESELIETNKRTEEEKLIELANQQKKLLEQAEELKRKEEELLQIKYEEEQKLTNAQHSSSFKEPQIVISKAEKLWIWIKRFHKIILWILGGILLVLSTSKAIFDNLDILKKYLNQNKSNQPIDKQNIDDNNISKTDSLIKKLK